MTLGDALRLMVETFGGAVLMLGAFWTVVTIEERLRLLINASTHPAAGPNASPEAPVSMS